MSARFTWDFRDMVEMEATLKAFGTPPQKLVTRAASKGVTPVRRAARGQAPVMTGTLKKAIVRHGERSRVKGKKVYDVYFDPALNSVLQRPIQHPGEAGGKNKHAYYPASMEYGFLTRSKGGGLRYVPGLHSMRAAAEATAEQSKAIMRKTVMDGLEQEWRKKHVGR